MVKQIAKGINAVGRAAKFKASYKFKHVAKGAKGKQTESKKVVVAAPVSKWYQTEDNLPKVRAKKTPKATKLRASITPGTVLIILAGQFRGCRVVFLKQLPSGLLMVVGPFSINGVPLRRVNQAYVIATSTKIDISAEAAKIEAATKDITDASFSNQKKANTAAAKAVAKEFTEESKTSKNMPADAIKAATKNVDKLITASIKKVPHLDQYLSAKFSLSKGQKPHTMKF